MNEHTKGLLRVGHSGAVVADHPVPEMSGSDAVEYYGGHLVAESVTAANARRLAACWNACDGFTTEELEAHTGPRLLRARLVGAFARIDELLSERNRVGIDISSAILSGIVPDRHPLRSRLELLANHHKRELMLAELLRRARRYVSPLSCPESEIQIVQSIVSSIDSVLAGKINFDLLMAAVHKIAPEGWQLVPVEPTAYQVLAGRNAKATDDELCVTIYLAMLSAAPKHQGGEPCDSASPSSSPD